MKNRSLSILLLLYWRSGISGSALSDQIFSDNDQFKKRSSPNHPNHQYSLLTETGQLRKESTRDVDETPSFFSETFNSTIIGKEMKTIKNRTIYAFEGFRYGEASTPETRFKPPIPAEKFWDGDVFEAIHIGFKCPQSAKIGKHNIAGEEDCLYLNVYTPYIPNSNVSLPVMFFIHGGAYTAGDASVYLPTKLLDHDVILVTIHYRLGALGFFCMNTPNAPCNAALYDMVEALRWTQQYIEDFGGNKNKVTIFGESAGSVSVNYMMIVEQAKGLFHGVIAESGSALDHWAIDENPLFAAKFIANDVGCPTDDEEMMFNCVVQVDAYDLIIAENKLVEQDRSSGLLGFRGAAPSVQNMTLDEDEYFDLILTMTPREYFESGNFSKVPFMTGANRQEGSYVLGIMYWYYLLPNDLLENEVYMREEMIQDILKSYGTFDETYSIAASLQQQYCPNIDLGDFDEAAPCLIDILGAMFLKAGSWETCNLHSYYSDEKTFYYSFEFESDDSMFVFMLGDPPFDPGITHSDELMYIFSHLAFMDNEAQVKTMDRMTKLWTNFAKYGDPTPAEDKENLDKLGIPDWTPYQFEDHHYMLIQDELSVGNEYTDRWTVTVDELAEPPQEVCEGICNDMAHKKEAYEISTIVFAVSCFFVTMIATYFFFKSRR